jgi:uracil-DNA glycosylase family 4
VVRHDASLDVDVVSLRTTVYQSQLYPMTKVKDVPGCANCPMRNKFPDSNFVPPLVGPSLRLVVAEAPGATESLEGKPLVGSSGRIFDSLLRKAAIPRESLTILNTIQCQPPNNVHPTDAAARGYCTEQEAAEIVRHCYREHVRPVLLSRPWERVDIVGGKALQLLTGEAAITKWRGSPMTVDTDEINKRLKL